MDIGVLDILGIETDLSFGIIGQPTYEAVSRNVCGDIPVTLWNTRLK
jgi:hypothetical protein